MTPALSPIKNRWAFSLLWTNVAVALVDLVVIATAPVHTLHSILQTLALHLHLRQPHQHPRPPRSRLAARETRQSQASQHQASPLGPSPSPASSSSAPEAACWPRPILTTFGFSPSHHFWLDYFHTLRFALPLALVFGLGAMTHASLLTRVHTMELQLHEKELSEERTRKLAAETRLRSLESWIHPHFLFNTLNSISALIPRTRTRRANRPADSPPCSAPPSTPAATPSSRSVRNSPLVESYLDIERVRLGEKLHATIEVPATLAETKVPPMSIQHLVENAVKYGITRNPTAAQSSYPLSPTTMQSSSTSATPAQASTSPPSPPTHGLDKLTQRLDALYSENASLKVFRRDNTSIVQMTIPRS